MPGLLQRLLPPRQVRSRRRDLRAFAALPAAPVDLAPLAAVDPGEVTAALADPAARSAWEHRLERCAALGIDIHIRGSSSRDDGRVLFSIARRFRPAAVVEVGTYLGAGTMALAASREGTPAPEAAPAPIVTVDMRDVNAPDGPWARYGANDAPAANLERTGERDLVQFVHGSSLDYLARTERRFDLVFLDGDHRAEIVYREVPLALRVLRPGGLVLLHDHWTDWRERPGACHGPAEAAARLAREHADLRIIQVRDLLAALEPGAAYTSSIAILTR